MNMNFSGSIGIGILLSKHHNEEGIYSCIEIKVAA
jgi:hypothetical protein